MFVGGVTPHSPSLSPYERGSQPTSRRGSIVSHQSGTSHMVGVQQVKREPMDPSTSWQYQSHGHIHSHPMSYGELHHGTSSSSHAIVAQTNGTIIATHARQVSPLLDQAGYNSPTTPHNPNNNSGGSSTASTGSQEKEKEKRLRVKRACIECNRVKVRCDNQRPCSRCVRLCQAHKCKDAPLTTRPRVRRKKSEIKGKVKSEKGQGGTGKGKHRRERERGSGSRSGGSGSGSGDHTSLASHRRNSSSDITFGTGLSTPSSSSSHGGTLPPHSSVPTHQMTPRAVVISNPAHRVQQ